LANLSTSGAGNPENLKRRARWRRSGNAIETAFPDSAGFSELRFAIEPIVKKRTKTEISLEIQEEVAVRAHRISMANCPVCRSEVRMIPANEAAMMAKVTARDIYEFVNSGHLHFTEDSHGLLYICSDSLRNLRRVDSGEIAKTADALRE
jgi:hypothetical protein